MSLSPISNLSTYAKAVGKAFVYAAADPTTANSWSLLGITEGDITVDEKFKYNDYMLPEWTGDAIHARDVDGQDCHLNVPLIWGAPQLYALVSPTGDIGGGRSKPIAATNKTVFIVPVAEVGAGMSNGTPAVGSGTITVAGGLGVGTFSATQAGVVTVGSIVVYGGVGYTVTVFDGTTGVTLSKAMLGGTFAAAPNVAASAFTVVTYTPAAPINALWFHKATFEPGQWHFKHAGGGKIIRSIGIRPMFDSTKPEGQMLYSVGSPELRGITTYRI